MTARWQQATRAQVSVPLSVMLRLTAPTVMVYYQTPARI